MTIKAYPEDISTEQVREFAREVARRRKGDHNPVMLAERVALELNHWEWLEREDHPIWDIATDVIAEIEQGG